MQSDAEFRFFCSRTRAWTKKPSVKASTARLFLESVFDRATNQAAKLNPKLTRLEAWNLLSRSIAKVKDDDAINSRIYRNILAEFGGKR